MKFKVVSSILAIFTLTGLFVVLYTDFENYLSAFISTLLYVLIPAYGAYGTWVKSRTAIIISLVYFALQSVRSVSGESTIPHIAPIAISFPIGDFSNGQGYLIDVFAISMAIFLAWLLKQVRINSNELESTSKKL